MEGVVSWTQLGFVTVIIMTSFGMAAWVLLRLTEIMVRLEQLATRDDLTHAKRDIYQRMDTQWNNWMEAHGALTERVTQIEIRLGPVVRIPPPS